MDVFIPYIRSGSGELQYALKSLNNLEHDINDIYIVGDNPYVDNVRHIFIEQDRRSPYIDVVNKLEAFLDTCKGDKFILTNDDIFIMKPTKIENWRRGKLMDQIGSRPRNDQYTKALSETQRFLLNGDYKLALSYELHMPAIYETGKARVIVEIIQKHYQTTGKVLLFRSLYGNMFREPSQTKPDPKNAARMFWSYNILSTDNDSFVRNQIGNYIRTFLK